jgi:hypothetical protein
VEETSTVEERSTRTSLLRRLGTFAAVGLGVALMPATARAQSGRCCKDTSCPGCSGGDVAYQCDGCGQNCCKCLPDLGQCFNSTCPCG